MGFASPPKGVEITRFFDQTFGVWGKNGDLRFESHTPIIMLIKYTPFIGVYFISAAEGVGFEPTRPFRVED